MNQDIFSPLYVALQTPHVQLLPLQVEHEKALIEVCKDGKLWQLEYTSVPHYTQIQTYIAKALEQKSQGLRVPFVVLDQHTLRIVGTTSFRDFVWDVRRVEIGYTWYAQSAQRSHINTSCKFLLLQYAFETLHANSVALRTDIRNVKSQKAIERLGAQRDGILRQDALRKDGSVRDTVMYSILKEEWLEIKQHLTQLLSR
ncbi:GNAT family protein [Acinetobacter bereziniae]|uniref:GNAT family N-acetyltransferase n=1 Tax=Acinetobacter bereziniae TaxID=106648 RepID=UPI0015804FE6|nr:GNAT family protein [Acinetobacter bereziniae]NUF63767.1 GNAT family N-acetyltransferase [Acinetobacter bereziniae]NUG07682.1 GNAT family N-acetyltransferase [Acinetobacter bereziniae]NUG64608.1 GNAT family N-acetyltransferase [Acinetobacter bereziniae]NUG70619.1 GNAT family N-acetyltransferase [Acinetobacter bereziniae]NUG81796.1 GNAT family N-acetyltransferase [Acinetobacter bereziniae]